MFHICGNIPVRQGLRHLGNLDLLLSVSTTSYWLYILFLDTIFNLRQPGENEICDLIKRYIFFSIISVQVTMFGIEVYTFKLLRISTSQLDYQKFYQWLRIQWAFFIVAIFGVFIEIFMHTLSGISAILLIKPAFRVYEVFVVTKFLRFLPETGEEVFEDAQVVNQTERYNTIL